jgi:hypothetical protein
VQLLAFHAAFAISILFGLLGIFFALRIHDEDAAASLQPTPIARVERTPAGVSEL